MLFCKILSLFEVFIVLQKLTILIDESGDNNLRGSGARFFIVSAVVIKTDMLDTIKEQFNNIVRNMAGGRLKSSNIAGDHHRRKKILLELERLPFNFHSLIVNKDKIAVKSESGLNYKKSFYKFFYDKIYEKLPFDMASVDILQHNIGSEEFMNGFKVYLSNKHKNELFSTEPNHKFVDDKDQSLIQLPDFIAGTLLYIYDDTKNTPDDLKRDFKSVLQKKDLGSQIWPCKSIVKAESSDNKRDNEIVEYNKNNIHKFIDTYSGNKDSWVQMQLSVLEFLVFKQIIWGKIAAYMAESLIEFLTYIKLVEEKITLEDFRIKIIAKLRDFGVLIAGDRFGYRLVLSTHHLELYINHGAKIILPMLNRIKNARNNIKKGIDLNWDILDSHPDLKDIIDGQ
jgi:hypothetical protein